MLHLLSDTATQVLHRWHFSWKQFGVVLALAVVGALVYTAINAGIIGPAKNSTPLLETPRVEELPQPPAPVVEAEPEAPTIRTITVEWKYGGKIQTREEALRLQIPEEGQNFVPGPDLRVKLNFFTEQGHARGDGTAFVARTAVSGDWDGWYFTPNAGTTWFQIENRPPSENIAPDLVAAVLEDETIVLYIKTHEGSFVYALWEARVPLTELD